LNTVNPREEISITLPSKP